MSDFQPRYPRAGDHLVSASDPRFTIPESNRLLRGIDGKLDSYEDRLDRAERSSKVMLWVAALSLLVAIAALVVAIATA